MTGKVQPAVVVAPIENATLRQCTLGHMSVHDVGADRVRFDYEHVNGHIAPIGHMAL